MKLQSIEQVLSQPWGEYFRISRSNGVWQMGDRESHFNANSQYSLVTYDISNGSVLLNHGTDGTLRALTTFRDTYRSCCHTRGWQGVWLAKDCSSHGPYSYTVNLGDEKIDLSDTDWDLTTGLLDNIFPITRFEHPRGVCEITLHP